VISLNDVYRKFGEASEAAQLLETELGTILFATHAVDSELFSGERREEAAEILKSINKSTLGQVIKRIGEKTRGSSGQPTSSPGHWPNGIACRTRFFVSTTSDGTPLRGAQ
jgi:hypothetical protein